MLTFIHTGMSNNSTQPTIKEILLKYVSLSQTLVSLGNFLHIYMP